MFVEELSIEGYKTFGAEFKIAFHKGLNVLVGENGTGKSSIIDALRLLLWEEDYRRFRTRDSDFHRPFTDDAEPAEFIRVTGRFSDLSDQEKVAFITWTVSETQAKLTLQIDNKQSNRGRFWLSYWGGKSKDSAFENELFDMINCVYLPPLRDAEAELRPGRNSRLARLLVKLNKQAIKDAKEKGELHSLVQRVDYFNQELEKDEAIANANQLIRKRLLEALGEVFSQDISLQFSNLDFRQIVQRLQMFFFPSFDESTSKDLFRSLEENSLGYNNLIYMATILAELTTEEEGNDFLKVLLIEEPEAHLHPQLQIRLLKYLEEQAKESNIQVIVTTHSPILASSISLNSIIHLSKNEDLITSVPVRNCGLSEASQKFLYRWMDVTKSTLLFAKGIIFVEGIAEAMLVSELARRSLKDHNASLADTEARLPENLIDAGISVINMSGVYFKHFMQMFCDLTGTEGIKSIPIQCSGITDKDPEKDTKPTFANLAGGNNSAIRLQDIINSSKRCRLFVSPLKTFEYDLAMHGENLRIMLKLNDFKPTDDNLRRLIETYSADEWTPEVKKNEENKAKVAYYLLNHIDKGDFAQRLADRLQSEPEMKFAIPDYIHQAILWVMGGSSDG